MALKLNETYPGRFNNPSAEYPQGSFKNRTAPGAQDGSYFEQQWANDHQAFLSSLLEGAGVVADGSVDEVGASQYYNALLQIIADNNNDNFNAAIATIASAATVNLTTGAPDTSQITISGSVAITGFTVAAGRSFIAKFTGACTLVNSGSLVTGTGANIVCADGDSCIIRATAASVVEVLAYTPGIPQEIGYRQTWQNVAGSRVAGTTYTNTTGRPIMVAIDNAGGAIFVNGLELAASGVYGVTFIVPAGATYSSGASVIDRWLELR